MDTEGVSTVKSVPADSDSVWYAATVPSVAAKKDNVVPFPCSAPPAAFIASVPAA